MAGLACSLPMASAADPPSDPELALQGEYAPGEKDEKGHAVQVIALGDKKFEIVHYIGGLPGDGWKRGDMKEKAQGELKDGVATFTHKEWIAVIKDGKLTAKKPDGELLGTLTKVERTSPTMGVKAPEGATVLFDGKNADAWNNGKIVEGSLLGATNCSTKKQFGDHTLHIEFRTPFMPKARGQGRGNSGVYVQGRYECQVLDSFGLEGENNECGGIYTIAKPIVNMCFPPTTWQTYDMDFTAAKYDAAGKKTTNAKVTIKHNGVVIHDNIELPKGTPGYKNEGAGPESIFLQDHGNPVAFRNIWIVEKGATK